MERKLRLRTGAVEWRKLEGEIVALELPTSRYISANRSGALLWEELAQETTRGALIERLAGAFSLPEEQAARDVDAFLADLERRGLLSDDE